MDEVYGSSHGLIEFSSEGGLEGGGGSGFGGFGLFDGTHTFIIL
jgi:hypothetical protein